MFTSTAGNICEMRRLIWQLFFCFDALQACHMCNFKHYNLSSNLSARLLWCMSWITGNISSVWSRFILRKCHFKSAIRQGEPPCRISVAGEVEKEGKETLKTSAYLQHPTDTGLSSKACQRHHVVFDKPRLKMVVWCCSVKGENADKHSNLLEMLRTPGQACS